jgi:hypothetical protein
VTKQKTVLMVKVKLPHFNDGKTALAANGGLMNKI